MTLFPDYILLLTLRPRPAPTASPWASTNASIAPTSRQGSTTEHVLFTRVACVCVRFGISSLDDCALPHFDSEIRRCLLATSLAQRPLADISLPSYIVTSPGKNSVRSLICTGSVHRDTYRAHYS